MPKKLENKLKKEAEKKGYTGKRKDRYIYGSLRSIAGWKPSKPKGGKRIKRG